MGARSICWGNRVGPAGGAALLPASWGTPSSAPAPTLPPRCALGSRAGGWHLTGAGLSRRGQCLRPVSAQPEALPVFRPRAGSREAKQALTPATSRLSNGNSSRAPPKSVREGLMGDKTWMLQAQVWHTVGA